MLTSVVQSPAGDFPPPYAPAICPGRAFRINAGPGLFPALAFWGTLGRRRHRFGPAFKKRFWYEGMQEDMPFGRCAARGCHVG
jgi:hypothetical protein